MFSRSLPVLAVLAVVLVLAGAVGTWMTHVARTRAMAPRTIQVTASYPGADAKVVADTVGGPIEAQVNGVLDLESMSSHCTDDGKYTLTLTFEPGSDLDIHHVLVQSRVAMAMPRLPEPVLRFGINVTKLSHNPAAKP